MNQRRTACDRRLRMDGWAFLTIDIFHSLRSVLWTVALVFLTCRVSQVQSGPVRTFTLPDRGGVSLITDGTGDLNSGYARTQAASGTTPYGAAIFGERIGGILLTEQDQGIEVALAMTNPGASPLYKLFLHENRM